MIFLQSLPVARGAEHTAKQKEWLEVAQAHPPFGPGFSADLLDKAVKMDVYGSAFDEPGSDYCEFVLVGADGKEVGRRRIDGY